MSSLPKSLYFSPKSLYFSSGSQKSLPGLSHHSLISVCCRYYWTCSRPEYAYNSCHWALSNKRGHWALSNKRGHWALSNKRDSFYKHIGSLTCTKYNLTLPTAPWHVYDKTEKWSYIYKHTNMSHIGLISILVVFLNGMYLYIMYQQGDVNYLIMDLFKFEEKIVLLNNILLDWCINETILI
jgi:hypothetical protein